MRPLQFLLLTILFPSLAPAQEQAPISFVLIDGWYRAINQRGQVLADSLVEEQYGTDLNLSGNQGRFPFYRSGRMGFRNDRNEIVIPPNWPAHHRAPNPLFDYGTCVVPSQICENGPGQKIRFGLIDLDGNFVADTVYDYIGPAQPPAGFRAAARGERLYLLDTLGRNCLPANYEVGPGNEGFRDGLLCIKTRIIPKPDTGVLTMQDRHRKYLNSTVGSSYRVGFINGLGELIIDTVYHFSYITCGVSLENKGTSAGLFGVDRCGSPRADYYRFRAGRCLVPLNGKPAVIDTKGKVLFRPEGYHTLSIAGNYLVVMNCVKEGLSSSLELTGFFGADSQLIKTGGLPGAVDGGDGLLLAGRQHRWPDTGYFFNRRGMVIGDTFFVRPGGFREGFAAADVRTGSRRTRRMMIDTQGRFLPDGIVQIAPDGAGRFIVKKRGAKESRAFGVMDSDYRWLIRPRFKALGKFEGGLAPFCVAGRNGDHWGYIDLTGKVVLPAIYKAATSFQAARTSAIR